MDVSNLEWLAGRLSRNNAKNDATVVGWASLLKSHGADRQGLSQVTISEPRKHGSRSQCDDLMRRCESSVASRLRAILLSPLRMTPT